MIDSASIELSIVTPMHNEEECIREFHDRVSATLVELGVTHEIVLVNDGSTDSTGPTLREICEKDPAVVGVFLARNRGQCTALFAGLQQSRGKYVVIMDGDLQHLPEEIPLLYQEAVKGFDLVKGVRTNRRESLFLRRLPSKIANYLLRATTKCPVRDMGGFSILRGEIARALNLRAGQHRLIPALAWIMGGSVSEVPISAPPRFAGQSHYGIGRSVDVLFDILMLWFQSSFKQRPLYLFGRISLALFVLATLTMVWLLYEKFFLGVDMGTRPPFMGAILFYIAAMGFMSTGFILEMVSSIHDVASQSKPYVVREIVSSGRSAGNSRHKEDK